VSYAFLTMHRLTIAAALLAFCAAGPVLAGQAPAPGGEWIGAVDSPTGAERMGLRLAKAADGSWTGVFDSIDQGARNIPVANVVAIGDRLAFETPAMQGRYQGQWDSKAGAWRGTFSQPQGSIALDFRKGAIPKAPEVSGLDGDWQGVVQNGDNPQTIVVHVRTTAQDGTTASIDNLTGGVGGMPVAHIERRGRKVRLQMSVLDLAIEGELDRASTTLQGSWTQDRQTTPLTLMRSGPR
jgi:hypothetical protein